MAEAGPGAAEASARLAESGRSSVDAGSAEIAEIWAGLGIDCALKSGGSILAETWPLAMEDTAEVFGPETGMISTGAPAKAAPAKPKASPALSTPILNCPGIPIPLKDTARGFVLRGPKGLF